MSVHVDFGAGHLRLIATTWTDCVLEAFGVAYAFGMREHLQALTSLPRGPPRN